MRVRSLTALLVFTCAASVGPSRAHAADDLMQVWRTALGSDPVCRRARQLPRQPGKGTPGPRRTAAADQRRGRRRLPRNPQHAGLQHGLQRQPRHLGPALTQPLFNWSRWQAYEQSKLLTADAEVRLQQAFQDLLLRVAEAYFNVLYAQDALTATEAEKAARRGTAGIGQAQFRAGQRHHHRYLRGAGALRRGAGAGTAAAERSGRAPRRAGPDPGLACRRAGGAAARRAPALAPAGPAERLEHAGRSLQPGRAARPAPDPNCRPRHPDRQERPLPHRESARHQRQRQRRGHEQQRRAPGKPINNSVGVVLSIPLYSGGGVSSQVTERVQLEQKARHDFEAARRRPSRPRASTTRA